MPDADDTPSSSNTQDSSIIATMNRHLFRRADWRYHFGVRTFKAGDAIILLIYAAALTISVLPSSRNGDILTVETEDGSYAYSLSEDGLHSFSGPLGTTVIEIRDGKARVISSPCRNGICMEAGWSSTLCCLPNRIIATVSGTEEDIDAISG